MPWPCAVCGTTFECVCACAFVRYFLYRSLYRKRILMYMYTPEILPPQRQSSQTNSHVRNPQNLGFTEECYSSHLSSGHKREVLRCSLALHHRKSTANLCCAKKLFSPDPMFHNKCADILLYCKFLPQDNTVLGQHKTKCTKQYLSV